MANGLRDELLKTIGKLILVIAVFMGLLLWIYFYNTSTQITGKIVGKHITGYGDKMHYVTVSDDEKTLDIKVSPGQYSKYNLFDKVYIDYSMMREAVSMTDAK